MSRTMHVVGGGLAGLAASVRLAQNGEHVVLSEAAGQAGGRCRSYYDASINCIIDNGNHLVLSGNPAVHSYLRSIGASALKGPRHAEFHFADVTDGARWTLRPNENALPWWLLVPSRRVPGTKLADYLRYRALARAGETDHIGDLVPCEGELWRKFLHPVLLSVLNTAPETASAKLAWNVCRETVLRGGHAYQPQIARPTLASQFVEPALAQLSAYGSEVRLGRRLKTVETNGRRVTRLIFADGAAEIGEGEGVVLATPAWVTADLLPGISAPDDFRSIVNAHFRIDPPENAPQMLGVIGGTSEWIFAFHGRISVTVSAAEAIIDTPREVLAARIWREVAELLHLPATLPPWQIVKEKRATFAATPEQDAKRPQTETPWSNLFLAGDWIDTGLPATIESALRSGGMAAAQLISRVTEKKRS